MPMKASRSGRLTKKQQKLLHFSLAEAISYHRIFHNHYVRGEKLISARLSFLWKIFSSGSLCSPLTSPPHSSPSLDLPKFVSIRCVPGTRGYFPSRPAALWKGWCWSSQSISAQKGSNVPSSKGVAVDTAPELLHTLPGCADLSRGS